MDEPSFLVRVPFLASLEAEVLRELAKACRKRRYKRGEALFHQEDPGSALYILQSGQVKIVVDMPDGGERILHVQGPGDYLGELALVDGAPRSATVMALEPTEAWVLYREEFLALLRRHPQAALTVMIGLAGMVRRLSQQVQDLTSLDVPGRLAKRLLELADQHGEPTPEGLRIALPLTQQELAEMIGATRVAVNQALSWYRSHGILTPDRDGIMIHQPEQLRKRIY